MTPHPFEELSAYVDGALSPERAIDTAAHLAVCGHCREVVGDLQSVRHLVRSLPAPLPHPAALPRTIARLEARQQRTVRVRRWIAAISVAGLIGLVLQLPVWPAPTSQRAGAKYFREHAQWTLTHPMTDVTLATYLSSPLPYERVEDLSEGP